MDWVWEDVIYIKKFVVLFFSTFYFVSNATLQFCSIALRNVCKSVAFMRSEHIQHIT